MGLHHDLACSCIRGMQQGACHRTRAQSWKFICYSRQAIKRRGKSARRNRSACGRLEAAIITGCGKARSHYAWAEKSCNPCYEGLRLERLNGGGGGDRTPVRKPSTARSTYIVRLFGFNPRHANRTGLTQASHLEFRVRAKRPCATLSRVYDSASDCSVHPTGEVVQSPAGIKRLERSCRRWQL